MRMRSLCLCIALLFLLGGCGKKSEKTAEEVLESVLALCEDAPTGVLYRSGSERGNEDYLSKADFDLLYGEGCADVYLPLTRDYALYLSSFATPFEVAVFRCYGQTDAERLGALLLSRSDALKVFLRELGADGQDGETVYVTVVREYAVLVMSDRMPTKGALSRAIK